MSPRTRALSSAIEFTHPTGVIPATATTTPSARVRRCPSTARRVRLLDEPRRRRRAIPRPTVRSSLRTPQVGTFIMDADGKHPHKISDMAGDRLDWQSLH